jgi:endonuclease/exonuclease/phosphatase family metal-dependent hydrolase
MTVLQKLKKIFSSGKARKKTEKGFSGGFRRILHRVFLGINIFFALPLLISYLAVHINPGDFALPAFFGLAYPYLLLINLVIVVLWAVNLRFEAFISIVVIAIGFTHFSNYIKLRKPGSDKEGAFKVMSYNLRLFNYYENKGVSDSEKKVFALVRSSKPQIICFQELYIKGDPEEKDREIKKALGGKYYSHTKLTGKGKDKYYGIATYSVYPIVGRGQILHPGSSSLSIYTDIVIESDTFRVFNNHLQSFRLRSIEESFMEELIGAEDKQTMNEVRSLSHSLREGFKRRALQSQVVKDYLNRSPYPVIVAGDFNDTPVSYAYRKIRKGLSDSFVSSGYGAGFTYRGNYPPNRIDYILYDNKLTSVNFEIIKVKYSDHYPIIAWFRKPG